MTHIKSILSLVALAVSLTACGRPNAKVVIQVVDESGLAVPAAEASATFERPYGVNEPARMETIRGQTDSNGLFVAKARTSGYVGWSASKPGHYRFLGEPIQLRPGSAMRWHPWGQTNVAVLKRIIKPIPMLNGGGDRYLPVSGESCGYDLEQDDWVAPHGRGKMSDFVFTFHGEVVNNLNFRGHLQLSFANPADGIVQVPFDRRYGSELRHPRTAPEAGFLSEWNWRVGNGSLKDDQFTAIPDQSTAKAAYIFRVRSVLDERGRIKRAYYGCLVSELAFDPRTDRGAAFLRFSYYLNPTPNDRNLERDPEKTVTTLAP